MQIIDYPMRRLLIAFTLAVMMCGCSLFEHPDVTCPDDGPSEGMTISFRLLTSSSIKLSRSDGEGHDEVGSEFKQFEDGIDMNDLGLFVFVGADDDAPLLFKTTDIGHSNDPLMTVTGSPGAYTVTMFFTHEQMAEKLGYNLDPNSDDDLTFRILIVANSSSYGSDGLNQIAGQNLSGVIEDFDDWLFGIDNIYNADYEGSDVVGRYSNSKSYLPMFGFNSFTVSQAQLYMSRPEDRFYLGEISMLRALAKVRVVDNIAGKNEDGYPRLVGAEFIGSQSEVRPLPADAINYENGTQVHTPNIADDKTLETASAVTYQLGTIPDNWNITPDSERMGATFIGYVPEQRIGHADNNVSVSMPVFRLHLAMSADATVVYDVSMTGYKNVTFDYGTSILRNHIYTLSVNNMDEILFKLTVDPWIPGGTTEIDMIHITD